VKDPSLKPVRYGPRRSWSKGTVPSEKKRKPLKRKSAPSSESDYDAEMDAQSIEPPTKKAMSVKKVPQEVEE
ncbi:hypothetical protein A2U01_0092776, partial [Trifolium medium]|nr:hypothetical protein [Trifolium medium]